METIKANFINFLALVIVGMSIIFAVNYNTSHIKGTSMEPTYSSGDVVMTRKNTDDIKVNDIITIHGEKLSESVGMEIPDMLKRVVAVPGDTVKMEDNVFYINGEPEDADYVRGEMINNADFEDVLGEDEFFVLGDNRNFSADSRVFGPVNRDMIVGYVTRTIRSAD